MRKRKRRTREPTIVGVAAAAALGVTLFGLGCGDDNGAQNTDAGTEGGTDAGGDTNPAPLPMDDGTIGTVNQVANGAFTTPMDSTPDPTGANIFFTGRDTNGN